jgi:hypothetical protein
VNYLIVILTCLFALSLFAKDRPKQYVVEFKGNYYGAFDPTASIYIDKKEPITDKIVKDTLANLKRLESSPALKKQAAKADPSLGALMDNTGIYAALATRYRYEPVMEGTILEQEPKNPSWFTSYVRKNAQDSAWARAVRNRFRSVEKLTVEILTPYLTKNQNPPFTVGNLGGAAGDDVSAGVARLTGGKGTTNIRQFIYDIDADAMALGEKLGKDYFKYPVQGRGDMNIIDLANEGGISKHLRKENVKWINSIGFFMEYQVEVSPGKNMSHYEKQRIFEAYCNGGVEHITFSAYSDHVLPKYVQSIGWKNFELDWTQTTIVQTLNRAGYDLKKIDSTDLPLMQVYYFKGYCP